MEFYCKQVLFLGNFKIFDIIKPLSKRSPSNYLASFQENCEDRLSEAYFGDSDPIALDEHQHQAMKEIVYSIQKRRMRTKDDAFSIVHCGGAGKTLLEANIVAASQQAKIDLKINDDRKDIVLVTERSLISIVENEFENLGLDVGVWGGGRKVLDRPVQIATIDIIVRNRKQLHKILPLDKIDVVVGDEADNYLTRKRMEVIEDIEPLLKLGFTATPTWADGRDISEVWGQKIHKLSLREGIANNINVPPLFYLYESEIDGSSIAIKKDDYDQKLLAAAFKHAELQKSIPDIYRNIVPEGKEDEFPALVYVPSVRLVEAVTKDLQASLNTKIVIKGWTGVSTSTEELCQDVEAFNEGRINILVLCKMGGRGLDLPRARLLIDAYPSLSRTKIEQRHSRVLRKIRPNNPLHDANFYKPFAVIAQVIPKSGNFRPICLPDILDGWEDAKKGVVIGNSSISIEKLCSISEEVDELRKRINNQKPIHKISLVKNMNIFEELKIIDNLPQADEQGFLYLEGKKYATIAKWMEVFDVSSILYQRMQKCKQKGISGKLYSGHILADAFFEEGQLQKHASDLISEIPKANDAGFFVKICKETQLIERYATASRWAVELGLVRRSVASRLRSEKGIDGRDSGGHLIRNAFYPESRALELCADLLRKDQYPQADAEGFFISNGILYGSTRGWKSRLPISNTALRSRLEGVKGKTARSISGRLYENAYYTEKVIRDACSDLLEKNLSTAGEAGFFEIDGVKYGTIFYWSQILPIGRKMLTERLVSCEPTLAKDKFKRIQSFYDEKSVREVCADILERGHLPQAKESGVLLLPETGRKQYATINYMAKKFNVSYGVIERRVAHMEGILSLAENNTLRQYYPVSEVRSLLKKTLAKQSKAFSEHRGSNK